MQYRNKLSIAAVFIFSLFFIFGCRQQVANRGSEGSNIICFGDSITEGKGSTTGNNFPSILAQKLNLRVINAGVSGDTTRDALKRIEKDVLERDPRLVIIEFCANDMFQNISVEETLENLDKMVYMVQHSGAMAVLAHVHVGLLQDQYFKGFKRIAKKRHALLIPDIMRGIVVNPDLKSDQIHPNDAGYRVIAERIYRAIRPLLERQ